MGGNRLNSIDAGFKQTWLWIPTLFPLISYLTLALVSLTTKWYPHPSPTMLCLRITIAVPPQPTLSVALILKSCNIKNFWDFVKANACIPSYEKKKKKQDWHDQVFITYEQTPHHLGFHCQTHEVMGQFLLNFSKVVLRQEIDGLLARH